MAGRISEDPPAARVTSQERGAKARDPLMRIINVPHVDVEVQLLRVASIRPPRWTKVSGTLERQDSAATGGMQRCEVRAY